MTDTTTPGRRPQREAIVVPEHQSAHVDRGQVTTADIERLRRLRDQRRIGLQKTTSGWTISARATIGVLVLDRVRLVLEPKVEIPGEQLITWLCYATSTPVPHEPTLRRWLIGAAGYASIGVAALLAECQKLLREGLRLDYRPVTRVEPHLRGKLDVRAQVTRGYGKVHELHLRTFERTPRIWENLICAAALDAALKRTDDKKLADMLAGTAKYFPPPPPAGDALRMLAGARYNRLNHRYRVAHTWARLTLNEGGVTNLLTERGLAADSMLLNMNVLWERVVRQMAHDTAAEFGGACVGTKTEPGIRTSGDIGTPDKPFVPDVLVRLPGAPPLFLPIDAKYKKYAGERVSATDRHQLLTYIAGYTAPDSPLAAVVHPAPEGETGRTLTITGPRGIRLGRIELLGLDTRLPPRQAAEPLRTLMSHLATDAAS
ncbi:McrC family protein [Streptomyces mayteni]